MLIKSLHILRLVVSQLLFSLLFIDLCSFSDLLLSVDDRFKQPVPFGTFLGEHCLALRTLCLRALVNHCIETGMAEIVLIQANLDRKMRAAIELLIADWAVEADGVSDLTSGSHGHQRNFILLIICLS